MVPHQRRTTGSNNHHVGCVYVQLRERWKTESHATFIGKTIVLWCACVMTRKCRLTGKSGPVTQHCNSVHMYSLPV